MLKRRKIFYGWWIVAASAALHFFGGGTFYYGFTVFFNPIRQTFGWTAAVTSAAFALQRLEAGILGPLAGTLVDRLGPRKLMLFGWSSVGLGFILMSRINSLTAFYVSFTLIAIGMSFASGLVTNTAIANWFSRMRSRAMTFTYIGPGLSGILVPLIAISVRQLGWRETLVATAIGIWLICIPLSLTVRHRPSQYGYLPDGDKPTLSNEPTSTITGLPAELTKPVSISPAADFTARQALKTRTFWLLSAVSLFQQIAMSAVTVHIVPYLESVGVPTAVAATAVTGLTLCSLIGRLGFGFLGDFKNKRHLIAIAIFLQTVGILIFSFINMDRAWLIIVFLLIFGPGYGAPIPLRPALQADYFGTRSFGTIMGLMSLISMTGGLASPVVAGWIFDVTGSYRLAWRIFALVTVPAIPLLLLAKPPKVKSEP
ncbi:MAG: MFS transporter [Chloroflexi bacterium]|nr:MFS transporter [Chloroflexota bacterium]